jgi:hypothetical protein
VKFKRYETSDLKRNVFGDAAVVTGRLKRVRENRGQEVEDDWRFPGLLVARRVAETPSGGSHHTPCGGALVSDVVS